MPRYAALVRGVSPVNCPMPKLMKAFESASFSEVKTVLASGNVVFAARATTNAALERRIETALEKELKKKFACIVRSIDELRALLEADPFDALRVAPNAKRVVTFLRGEPKTKPKLPIERDGTRIFALRGSEAFTAYVPHPKGAVFMVLLERTFGKEQTTRTWDSVAKIAR
jgi:uncharacterized protein (DUF1697 family)